MIERRQREGSFLDRVEQEWDTITVKRQSDIAQSKTESVQSIFEIGQSKIELRQSIFSADDIKSLRRRLGITQTSLGQMIGVSHMTIWHWEHGSRQPSRVAERVLMGIRSEIDKI